MLDIDIARLYGIRVGAVLQAVRRNPERFPEDFMFSQNLREKAATRRRHADSGHSWGGARGRTHAFTEQGVAMLSSVLRSPRAVRVNIEIMRAFVRLRRLLMEHADLAERVEELEKRYEGQFQVVFDALGELMKGTDSPSERIGFRIPEGPPPPESNGAPRGAP